MVLEDLGYVVVGEAKDGQEALDLTHRERPDLVILDIKMPGLDGIEVAEKIAHQYPVMILTAYTERHLIRRAKGLLMSKESLTEADAYRRLQKISMDKNRPTGDLFGEWLDYKILFVAEEREYRAGRRRFLFVPQTLTCLGHADCTDVRPVATPHGCQNIRPYLVNCSNDFEPALPYGYRKRAHGI
ncbi:MAG: response regulator [Deltaproteobacteria bacterium]